MNTELIARQPGIPCPDCSTVIPVTIEALLGPSGTFTCLVCGRTLTLMRAESSTGLSELQKVHEAQKSVKPHSRINL